MYDKIIRRFSMEGKLASSKIAGARDTYSHQVLTIMRLEGFLPVLDLEPSWWVKYLPEEDAYEVRYADQAIYYGKDDIDKWAGWYLEELLPTTNKQSKTSS